MADRSKIEWTDSPWTPIRARDNVAPDRVGWHCEKVSEACRNCYAESTNKRLGTRLEYKPGNLDNVEIFLDEKMLLAPLKWRKPRKIFVCSTTDLFGDWVEEEWLDRIFAVMALCPQHTFQVLTKRPKRTREYLSDANVIRRIYEVVCDLALEYLLNVVLIAPLFGEDGGPPGPRVFLGAWPLPNIWLGVTAENQETADTRIPDLLATPATVRFVSVEPMLGPIELCGYIRKSADWKWFPVECRHGYDMCPLCDGDPKDNGLDWVIAGGESGPHARPIHPYWARSLRDQCAAAGVPFLFKQWGEWLHNNQLGWWPYGDDAIEVCRSDGDFYRVGKRAAGRLLDGVEHNEFPKEAS